MKRNQPTSQMSTPVKKPKLSLDLHDCKIVEVLNESTGQDFQRLEAQSQKPGFSSPCNVAEASMNCRKNRYRNVLACDATRFVLPVDPYENRTDYINASWIHKKQYIAAQGPLRDTVEDFWMMIWEAKVPVIVMLTKEDGIGEPPKCVKYWPSHGMTGKYGYIRVEETSKSDSGFCDPSIICRAFKVTHTGGPTPAEPRIVHHYQYLGWPDHGVPKNTGPFLHLIQAISGLEPVLVHCSAGVGRTGTFCCVDILSKQLKSEYPTGKAKRADIEDLVFNTVLDLRKQRPGMVQTQEQYEFCFKALVSLLSQE
jgi:protein tyrosine phosphatase